MQTLKYLPHPLMVGVLAGLMQLMGMTVPMFLAWAGFAAWACYFLAGCTPRGGMKVIGCWVGGVVGSVVIIELGKALTGAIGTAEVAFPLAVGAIAFVVICFEKVPALNMIPAWFIGAACFFAYNEIAAGDYSKSVPAILVSCVIGQVFGVVTVFVRTKYGQMAEARAASKKIEPAAGKRAGV
jgi:hypothetical protein